MARFKYYRQPDQMDCGPTCLRMIAKFYGMNYTLQTLRLKCGISKNGVSMLGLSDGAEKIGFKSLGVKLKLHQLSEIKGPIILHWRQSHFVVLLRSNNKRYRIADPADTILTLNESEFKSNWLTEDETGVALILTPTPMFYAGDEEVNEKIKWSFLFYYLKSYRKLITQIFLGLAIGSLLQLAVPFLTQSVVDVGINTKDISFISVVLIAQTALIVGRVSIEFIRSWILLHISTRINISILTDFLIKLMKLPISFFDVKMTGDIMQRMNDQKRIETFLTGIALNAIFSVFNLAVFSIVLARLNGTIFFVYLISSGLYLLWITIFLRQRRVLDYKSFGIESSSQSMIVQLVSGMQEIKLNNCERQKRWDWEHIQARIFKYKIKVLALSQFQQGGSTLINEGANLIITYLGAKAVIHGSLTLGGLVALQYILGQLNSPIQQLLSFMQGFQDSKISLERLNEIHQIKDEEPAEVDYEHTLPEDKSIKISNLIFRYPGIGNDPVIRNITLDIPQGKTTAIVGMSGSGKTSLLKLLLRFYEFEKGNITVGGMPLNKISFKTWRQECGVVMQDGFIFSDTIARNITVGDEYPDKEQLQHAIKIANVQDLIDGLPLGLNTKIGSEGNGISQGQKQRILIARAVYKNPQYIFFDEATNSLDANNEKVIIQNLQRFFEGRTVVVVAHRLSTVSHADNIILMKSGVVVEQGTHQTLSAAKGEYYQLVKNQLELGE
ncbi:peptidase domain-containing ABC transporter [Mucilaginibacter daejeonensis]|uniref:peptidase domain-containing ABC transporter n=1 Tax=Mucilaginibacter daejeonensis TaxID=398049 RepID=UPI001D17B0CD|nr:peptidase domain-containing ABC transporter [Mucilaginibacter daejeonensis]UEG51473.1 peptidase domain-containing ABC transporter [Mucilaginibacter daejeonensis]